MSDAHFILQSDSSDHSYSQLCDSQWVAVDVYLCFHWSPANSGQACFSCTLHCEISSHIMFIILKSDSIIVEKLSV